MQADCARRLRWSPLFAAVAVLVFLVGPPLTRSQPKVDADKPKENTPSSYDQIAPVLLGWESFQDVLAKDKADKEAVMADTPVMVGKTPG